MSPPEMDGTCAGEPDPVAPEGRRGARILAYTVVLGCFFVVPGVVFGLFWALLWALSRR